MSKIVPMIILFLISGILGVNAENPYNTDKYMQSGPQGFRSLDQYLGDLKASSDPSAAREHARLEKLLSGALQALVIRNGEVRKNSSNAAFIDSDVASLDMLEEALPGTANPEMLLIRIDREDEILTNHNISQKIFSRIRYIYLLCSFKPCATPGCEPALFIRMVAGNADPAPVLLYKVSVAN